MWVLGPSLRHTCAVLEMFGVSLSHMTVWRDLQEQAEGERRRRQWLLVHVLGVDGAYVRCGGRTRGVLVAVDLGSGEPVAVGMVDEADTQAVVRFLRPLVRRLVASDDLGSLRVSAERLRLEHQVCQFHLRRWVGGDCDSCERRCGRSGWGWWSRWGRSWKNCRRTATVNCCSSTGRWE